MGFLTRRAALAWAGQVGARYVFGSSMANAASRESSDPSQKKLKARPVFAGQINGHAILDAAHFDDSVFAHRVCGYNSDGAPHTRHLLLTRLTDT